MFSDRPRPLISIMTLSFRGEFAEKLTYVQGIPVMAESHTEAIETRKLKMLSHLLCTKVLILKPSVGLTSRISSPFNFLRIVVFPALSKPLDRS